MKDSLYIVIPAYNESENIESCVKKWHPIIEQIVKDGGSASRLIVIDDGSKDTTYEILLRLTESYPYLIPVTKENGGHGATVLYGYRMAIDSGVDYVFQTDADGQTNPDEFNEFWRLRYDYDAIIGNRVKRGDGITRKIVENVVCLLLRMIFQIKVKDANAPFRLMKTSLVKKYIDWLPEKYNLPNIMFTTYFVYFHEKVRFVPISFGQRQNGVNSINVKKIITIGWKAIGDFAKLRNDLNNEHKEYLE